MSISLILQDMNRVLSLLIFIFISNFVFSQGNKNPFELKQRLTIELKNTQNLDSSYQGKPSQTNPFEKISTLHQEDSKSNVATPISSHNNESTIPRSNWFWLLLFLTLLVAIVINLNRSILTNLVKAWTNANYCNLLQRDKKRFDRVQYIFLAIVYYFNLAILLTFGIHHFYNKPPSFQIFISCLALVSFIYAIRHGALTILSKVFSIGKEALQFSFSINLFNMINGLVLLILNYFIALSPLNFSKITILTGVALIAIQLIYRSIRGLILAANHLFNNQIHFFLYLCTFEIAPIVVGFVYLSRLS